MEELTNLIRKAHEGDQQARDKLVLDMWDLSGVRFAILETAAAIQRICFRLDVLGC